MNASADVTPEIASYIRQNEHMPFPLVCYLAEHAIIKARDDLDRSGGPGGALTAHQAFQIIIISAHQGAEEALRNRVENSTPLQNIMTTYVDDQEEWYSTAAQWPAGTAINQLRQDFTKHYGFPVITADAVQRLNEILQGRQVLEVGAGNGYLTKQLQVAGIDLHHPKDSGYALGRTLHTTVINIDAMEAIRELPQMDLLWSWPCREEASGLALKEFQGELLVYIGEQNKGCTGGDLFHQLLDDNFEMVEQIPIPVFPHIHDSIGVYQRTGK